MKSIKNVRLYYNATGCLNFVVVANVPIIMTTTEEEFFIAETHANNINKGQVLTTLVPQPMALIPMLSDHLPAHNKL